MLNGGKVYGDADPSLTYQVSGLKNGDTAGAVLTLRLHDPLAGVVLRGDQFEMVFLAGLFGALVLASAITFSSALVMVRLLPW